ncbi:MAG: hypothetical protein CVU60_08370 [Deltaproteobacteria bacterium HGW-Deltaproteobacteria-18]|nr:MAG: hypothetical protein CVU60_08370 [Deltaproteobacteria bacterium HGW-Deltaproteobacteria-18]
MFEDLNALHEQFLVFREDDIFRRYGFTYNSPYADWLQRVREQEQDPATGEVARLLAGLSIAYRTHGAKSAVYAQFEERFDKALRTPVEHAPPLRPVPAASPVPGITILFSGDTRGDVFSKPGLAGDVGGLARRPATIAYFREKDPGVLLLDAGDAFASGPAGSRVTNQILVRAMNRMNYDAMGLGPEDMAIGEVALRELAGMAKFPLVCSNLEFRKGIAPWIRPYVILERNQRRVAVMSLLPPVPGAVITGARFIAPSAALRTLLPALRSKADCIVLLTQFGSQNVAPLLGDDEGFDVILGDSAALSQSIPAYMPAVPGWLGFGSVRLEMRNPGRTRVTEAMPVLLGVESDVQIFEMLDELE